MRAPRRSTCPLSSSTAAPRRQPRLSGGTRRRWWPSTASWRCRPAWPSTTLQVCWRAWRQRLKTFSSSRGSCCLCGPANWGQPRATHASCSTACARPSAAALTFSPAPFLESAPRALASCCGHVPRRARQRRQRQAERHTSRTPSRQGARRRRAAQRYTRPPLTWQRAQQRQAWLQQRQAAEHRGLAASRSSWAPSMRIRPRLPNPSTSCSRRQGMLPLRRCCPALLHCLF